VIPTGDEITPVGSRPAPGRIRNSNGPMLAALARGAGAQVDLLDPARDEIGELRERIRTGLRADVLVLSGGVSMGRRDRVIPALRAEGVEPVFHKVAIRPGKPLFFGLRGRTLVFGLPGNPVSSYLDFLLFVEPALHRLGGRDVRGRDLQGGRAAFEIGSHPDLRLHVPCRVVRRDGDRWAEPVGYRSSGDLFGACSADAMVIVAPGIPRIAAGDRVDLLPLDSR
jgi:molybdopterin molybdotransferase